MPTYKFEAMSAKGEEVKDSIEAASEEEAQQKIRQMGYYVTKLQEVRDTRKKGAKAGKQKDKKGKTFTIGGVSQKQLCTFTRQFSVLQDAGLPVLRSLKILKGQLKPGVLRNALIDVVDDVESGTSLSESLGRHPKVFDRLYVNMVRAGEVGGALEVILRRLADFLEKAQSLKRKVIGAMIYPVVVILAAVGILSFIMIAIVPKFKEIFQAFDMKLPAMTQTLLDIADFMKQYFWIIPLVLIGWLIFCRLLRLMYWGRYVLDWVWLHVPVIGGILEKTIVARTMRTLGTLVSSGVPILEALSIVKETAGNAVFEEMFQRVFESVREGESIAMPMKESRLVDDMVVNMIDVGEETGELDKMLNKIADVYDEEVDVLVQGLVKLLEPLMVLFLGGCVGFIVVALFMPMLAILEKLSAGAGG
ncbi:MAG: type II secretion system F family protein [Gemmatales bacterium]|nr:type II secretion system F family protein [Gemmatales bacterium]MDW7995788.1 type II secretion system F family protein [Gemmatales bacterium]